MVDARFATVNDSQTPNPSLIESRTASPHHLTPKTSLIFGIACAVLHLLGAANAAVIIGL